MTTEPASLTLAELAETATLMSSTLPYKEVHAHSIDALAKLLGIERPLRDNPTLPRGADMFTRFFGLPVITAPQLPLDVVKLIAHDGTVTILKMGEA